MHFQFFDSDYVLYIIYLLKVKKLKSAIDSLIENRRLFWALKIIKLHAKGKKSFQEQS